jgi:hypothetical protein
MDRDYVVDVHRVGTSIPLASWVLSSICLHGIFDRLGASYARKPRAESTCGVNHCDSSCFRSSDASQESVSLILTQAGVRPPAFLILAFRVHERPIRHLLSRPVYRVGELVRARQPAQPANVIANWLLFRISWIGSGNHC